MDSRMSIDTVDSRERLLTHTQPRRYSTNTQVSINDAELESIIAKQQKSQDRSLGNQRVKLSSAQLHGMQMAQLASAVGRMSALRFRDQECTVARPVRERRASDIELMLRKMDRLDQHGLNTRQRFVVTHERRSPDAI
ncbi:hypothetical protein GGI07_002680 [Coemansia sp. Benny D115]|nr:hypothetical protein GGI07_002680 [Coemansia sp. Benny D115]